MHDLQQDMSLAEELVRQWGLQVGDKESAFGEMAGMPVALTILSVDPLSLMMAYKITMPHPAQVPLAADIARLVEAKKASVALEDGFAWLSLYHLDGKSTEAVRGLFESFGETLKQQGLASERVCTACGQPEEAGLLFLEGKCTRICESCLEQRLEEREQKQAALNRPSRLHSYALPWVIALAGLGWAVFWILVDWLLAFFNTQFVEINVFTITFVVVVGFLVGAPLGHVLRKSGTVRWSPLAVTVICIGLAVVIGETLYVTYGLFRWIGQFDLALGFQFLIPFLKTYDPSWLGFKFLVAMALGMGCFAMATERESVGLSV
jgi:hypothetical protein